MNKNFLKIMKKFNEIPKKSFRKKKQITLNLVNSEKKIEFRENLEIRKAFLANSIEQENPD